MDKFNTYKIFLCEKCGQKVRIPEGVQVKEFFFPGVRCSDPPHAWNRSHDLEEIEAKKIREPF